MFKEGSIIVCKNILGYIYKGYKVKDIVGIKIGKRYNVVSSNNSIVTFLDDSGTLRRYSNFRFRNLSIVELRSLKLDKILKYM